VGRLLVISGVPASGKSSYCQWLTWQGWTFINHDRANTATRPIDQTWWRLVVTGRAVDFLKVVTNGDRDVVLEFGFPMALLPQVERLKIAGVRHWWFDANHDTARTVFLARNQKAIREHKLDRLVPLAAFDNYVRDITAHHGQIREIFGSRVIETLLPNGSHLTFKEIQVWIDRYDESTV